MPRRHNSGWELFGYESDPTPGDPAAIRAVSTTYAGIAEQARRAQQLLVGERIRDGAGDAMRELNARVGELPDKLRRTHESFERVALAYGRYAGTLEDAQDMLDRAIDRAQAVHATASEDPPEPPAADATPAQVQDHERRSGAIDAARTELGAAERLAAEARSLREDGPGGGSRHVERELDDAAAGAIEERGLWDKTVDLFDDAGEAIDKFFAEHPWVETVLQIAVGILTIAFPVLGLVLGAVLLLVQAWRMAATGNWDVTALAIGVLALAGGGIVRGLALAGRLGPVANALRAVSTRTGPMRAAVTSATASVRTAGRTVGAQMRTVVRPLLRGRTEGAIRAGREGLTEGASEAAIDVGIRVATGQDVNLRDVATNAAVGSATGAGGRGLADGLGRSPATPSAPEAGDPGTGSPPAAAEPATPPGAGAGDTDPASGARPGAGDPTLEPAAVANPQTREPTRDDTPVTPAPATAAAAAPIEPGRGVPDGAGGGLTDPPSAASGDGAERLPAALGDPEPRPVEQPAPTGPGEPSGGSASPVAATESTEGAPARPSAGAAAADGGPAAAEPAQVTPAAAGDGPGSADGPRGEPVNTTEGTAASNGPDPDPAPAEPAPTARERRQELVVDERLLYDGDPLRDPRAPGVQTPFRQQEGLAADTDFVVVDRQGQYRGVFHTDGTGRISEVTTTSSAVEAFQLDTSADVRYLRDGLNPDLTNRRAPTPGADGTLPVDPTRYTNLLPEATYHVDGRYEIATDDLARVHSMEIHDIDLRAESPPRSAAQQRNAADLGRLEFADFPDRWNGGHDDANQFSGPAEGVNQHAMLEQLNQRRAAHPDNWYAFEQEMRGYAEAGHDVRRVLTFEYDGAGRVPHRIDVEFQVDGGPPQHRTFDNVPTSAGGAATPDLPEPDGLDADGPQPDQVATDPAGPPSDAQPAELDVDLDQDSSPAVDPAGSAGPDAPTEIEHYDPSGRTIPTDELRHPDADLLDDQLLASAAASPDRTEAALTDGLPAADPRVQEIVPPDFDPHGALDEAAWNDRYWPDGEVDRYGNRVLTWPDPDLHPQGFDTPQTREPITLQPGETIDRFGPGFGRFASPPQTPFPDRGLPPEHLDAGYHRYEVVRPLPIWAGRIAPAMGQPGGGTQYYMPTAIVDLVHAGYLREVTP